MHMITPKEEREEDLNVVQEKNLEQKGNPSCLCCVDKAKNVEEKKKRFSFSDFLRRFY